MKILLFLFRAAGYALIFAWEIVVANLQIARLILSPKLAFRSGAVKYKTRLRTKTEMLVLTNSITLTPGTLVMDADFASGTVLVHSMTGESASAMKEGVKRFPDDKVMWLFGHHD